MRRTYPTSYPTKQKRPRSLAHKLDERRRDIQALEDASAQDGGDRIVVAGPGTPNDFLPKNELQRSRDLRTWGEAERIIAAYFGLRVRGATAGKIKAKFGALLAAVLLQMEHIAQGERQRPGRPRRIDWDTAKRSYSAEKSIRAHGALKRTARTLGVPASTIKNATKKRI